MDTVLILIIEGIVVFLIGGGVGAYLLTNVQNRQGKNRKLLAETEAKTIIATAHEQSALLLQEGEERVRVIQEEAESVLQRRRRDLDKEEERLQKRREDLDVRLDKIEKREQASNKRQSVLDKRENDIKKVEQTRQEELERIAQMTVDEARVQLLQLAERDARNDIARIIRQVEAEAREEADTRARNIISLAVQRLASEHISEISVSVVPLPGDEMKGRIIGRNGRNIRAFELAAGVDVVVDDTPEAITISSFDPIRREIAKQAMMKLVVDGRIHPARIEKLLEDAKAEVERTIRDEGERAAYETGVHALHPEIIKLIGRLKFRYSYGQNQHAHSIETAHIAGMIAAELGADVQIAKAGGLLHDIGKAIDHEVEGTHALIGADFLKRYGIKDPRIINAVASHHHEVEQEYIESYIVEA
ncbi:MAG: ribonuclease Y, partial [Anaerolineae bacterium]|nr:ribonuclease Y [Anaerolineae bacterium]